MKNKAVKVDFYKHLSNILFVFGLILLTPLGRLSQNALEQWYLEVNNLWQVALLIIFSTIGTILIILSLYIRWKKLD